jgi:hypothetical protein
VLSEKMQAKNANMAAGNQKNTATFALTEFN